MPVTGGKRLNVIEEPAGEVRSGLLKAIIQRLPFLARLYGRVRLRIIPSHFIDAIEQHLPRSGTVVEMGCGIGLFTLYFAIRHPHCHFIGVELSQRRIRLANSIATDLQLSNVEFVCRDAAEYELPDRLQGLYCIDFLHHIPPAVGDQVLRKAFDRFEPGAVIIVKDIGTRPRPMLYFTFLLDLLVSPQDRFYYRSEQVWHALFSKTGFVSSFVYQLRSFLPYPHFLLVGRKPVTLSSPGRIDEI